MVNRTVHLDGAFIGYWEVVGLVYLITRIPQGRYFPPKLCFLLPFIENIGAVVS
jgi:hypothetical protein